MTKHSHKDLTLVFEEHQLHFTRSEPDENLIRRQGIRIVLRTDLDVVVGRMEVAVVDLAQVFTEDESVVDACDAYSQPLFDWANLVFDPNERFNDEVLAALDLEPSYKCLAYIDSLVIEPEYRGSKLGLAALYTFLTYGCLGCGSVYLKAFPILPEGAESPGDEEHDRSCTKLRELYASVGFKRIGSTDYMGLNTDFELPDFPA